MVWNTSSVQPRSASVASQAARLLRTSSGVPLRLNAAAMSSSMSLASFNRRGPISQNVSRTFAAVSSHRVPAATDW